MDSNGTAEVPLLRFYSTEFGEIWVEITQNVNSMGSMNFVKFRSESELWSNKKHSIGTSPFKKGDYTDVVLDIIGGENSQALHGMYL